MHNVFGTDSIVLLHFFPDIYFSLKNIYIDRTNDVYRITSVRLDRVKEYHFFQAHAISFFKILNRIRLIYIVY